MSLLGLIVALIVVGVLMYCINAYVPMEPRIKNILNIVVIVAVVIFALNAFGIFESLRGVRVPRVG